MLRSSSVSARRRPRARSQRRPAAGVRTRSASRSRRRRPAPPARRSAPSPALDLHLALAWPAPPAYVVTMRPDRWRDLRARVGPWAAHLTPFAATNGAYVDRAAWARDGLIQEPCPLRRGELGCYDSHVRLWRRLAESADERWLILEDDVDLRYTAAHHRRLTAGLAAAAQEGDGYDILYVGHTGRGVSAAGPGGWGVPHGTQGTYAYVLTREAARRLLPQCQPYREAVDVFLGRCADRGGLRARAFQPRLCYVVDVVSDTVHIR